MASMNEIDGELELLAFQYVSGELAAEEIAQFEARLVDDQSAREAVARVVQIGQAVVLAESSKLTSIAALGESGSFSADSAQGHFSRWVFAACSIAVAFLAGIGISHWLESSTNDPGSNMAARDDAHVVEDRGAVVPDRGGNGAATDVVALWSASATDFVLDENSHSAAAGDNVGEESPEMLPLDGGDSWLAADERAAGEEGEFRVPSWMLAAVSPDDDPDSPGMMSEEN